MKKLMFIAVFSMALGVTSCGEDDVVDFACDTVRGTLRESVQLSIDAYEEDMTSQTLCETARTAIEEYQSNECGDDFFNTVLAELPDCSTIGG